jgi:hypothetical protein
MARTRPHYRPKRANQLMLQDITDVTAYAEGQALNRLSTLVPRRITAHITSGIAWSPKKPSGTNGWLRMFGNRRQRGQLVRGRSNRTPRLEASFVRAFGTVQVILPDVG